MRKLWIALFVMTPCLFANGNDTKCTEVSGGIVTNVLSESGTVNGMDFNGATLGTATGDLKGGLGVFILGMSQGPNNTVVVKVHHHWVTEAGDTIFLEDATATSVPVAPGVFATPNGSYVVNIIGGTGRFVGATGQLSNFGMLDLNQGKGVLRYQGTICLKPQAQ